MGDNVTAFLARLMSISNVADRVRFTELMLTNCKQMPKEPPTHSSKNKIKSISLRQQGNKLFTIGLKKNEHMYEALELYNQSICFAECKSEDLAIGYANRSAVYFEWKMYEECLANIKLARETNAYPQRLLPKLAEREQQCRTALKATHKSCKSLLQSYSYEPKLSHDSHPEFPFASNVLEIQQNQNYGRYISTTSNINPGQILAIDDAFVTVLKDSFAYKRCANCLSENQLNLIPCTGCTSAMFCSEDCALESNASYHGFECKLNEYFIEKFSITYLIAIRMTIRAFQSFDCAAKLLEFIQEYGDVKSNVFAPLTAPGLSPDQQSFHQIYSLETNESKRQTKDLFKLYEFSALASHQLVRHTRFKELCPTDQEKSLLMELLVRFGQISSTNSYCFDNEYYSAGIYPFCSLLNHSCAPNIKRFGIGKKIVVMALRPILADEQIFDNYGVNHFDEPRDKRQALLKVHHYFDCDCIACQKNFPLWADIPVTPVPFKTRYDVTYYELNEDFVKETIKNAYAKLNEMDIHYPNYQICAYRELLRIFYYILLKNVPFKLSFQKLAFDEI